MGIFIIPWVERPFPWLTTHQDHKDRTCGYPFVDLYNKTEERIKHFPPEIQALIPPDRKRP
jgi:hypothetical protein